MNTPLATIETEKGRATLVHNAEDRLVYAVFVDGSSEELVADQPQDGHICIAAALEAIGHSYNVRDWGLQYIEDIRDWA